MAHFPRDSSSLINLQDLLFTAFDMFCKLPEKRLSVEERGSPSARQQLAN